MTSRTDFQNRTIPAGGSYRYTVSPSLPSAIHKHAAALGNPLSARPGDVFPLVNDGAKHSLPLSHCEKATDKVLSHPVASAEGPTADHAQREFPLLQSVLPYPHHPDQDVPPLSQTVAALGPASRRLLHVDGVASSTTNSTNRKKTSLCPSTVSGETCKRLKPGHSSAPRRSNDAALRSKYALGCRSHRLSATIGSALPNRTSWPCTSIPLSRQRLATSRGSSLPQTISGYNIVTDNVKSVPCMLSTGSRLPHTSTPLVNTLTQYVQREVQLTADGRIPTAEDQLGPYREAFGALIEAFPGYGPLLSDIRSAYDNVIQLQSELLTDAYEKESSMKCGLAQHRDEVSSFLHQIGSLQSQLELMRQEMSQREVADPALRQRHGDASDTDNVDDLRNHLDWAQNRVMELEALNKGDLEKILVLIGAVRECDKRLKAFESQVALMSGQVEELDEFRRLAGEAQSELQQYKMRFQAYVAAEDFQLMKEHLTNELTAAQLLARRMRRTAVIRGTQVDVMSRRLALLEEERELLLDGKELPEVMTPRPNWSAIYEKVPDLKEHIKPVSSFLTQQPAPADSFSHESATGNAEGEQLVVAGPTKTAMQVEFLVDRLTALDSLLQETVQQQAAADQTRQHGRVAAEAGGLAVAGSHATGWGDCTAGAHVPGKARSLVGLSSKDTFSRLQLLPLIGMGVSARVPIHLRACGVIERIVLDHTVSLQLIYDFFRCCLKPNPDALSADCDVPLLFHDYLSTEMGERSELNYFDCPTHVALNLTEDAKDPTLTNPALVLLARILDGSMPARLAVDAVAVVAHIMDDLRLLAKEQQKGRIRRPAISECLHPVLELKSPEEIAELRGALGNDSSFDVISLLSIDHRLMRALFFQECMAGINFYVTIVRRLTERAKFLDCAGDGQIVSLSEVSAVIRSVEPLTPDVVVRELAENATGDDVRTASNDDVTVMVRMSDVLRAMATAPLIRRSPLSTREVCTL